MPDLPDWMTRLRPGLADAVAAAGHDVTLSAADGSRHHDPFNCWLCRTRTDAGKPGPKPGERFGALLERTPCRQGVRKRSPRKSRAGGRPVGIDAS